MSFTILGTGHALPKLCVTNGDLAKRVDTSDEWIVSKTGIKERRILSGESLTDLSVSAAEAALENAGISAKDLDLIIYATLCGDLHSPSMACIMAKNLGAACPAFDVNAACTGFINALDIAAGYYARGKVKKVLIVCGEQMSRLTDWSDRSTCVLFGDAAGAVVLGEGSGLLSIKLDCTPNDSFIRIPFSGGDSPFSTRQYETPFLYMNGQEVYKFAVSSICRDVKEVVKDAGLCCGDVDYVLLHQANMRIIDTAVNNLKISKEKYLNCIERTGNISAVSIPVLLDEANRKGMFKKGDIIAMSAFGAGLITGAAVFRWGV